MKRFICFSAFFLSVVWFLVFLIGGLIFTNGDLSAASGGALIFALIPSFTFSLIFFFQYKNKSNYFFATAITFWLSIIGGYLVWVFSFSKADHWPVALAIIYVTQGFIAILTALVLIILNKRGNDDKTL